MKYKEMSNYDTRVQGDHYVIRVIVSLAFSFAFHYTITLTECLCMYMYVCTYV